MVSVTSVTSVTRSDDLMLHDRGLPSPVHQRFRPGRLGRRYLGLALRMDVKWKSPTCSGPLVGVPKRLKELGDRDYLVIANEPGSLASLTPSVLATAAWEGICHRH